jgi:hypothetical protein
VTSVICRYAAIYKKQYNKAAEDVQLYVANPINAYTLVKRLTTDWKEVENLISTDVNSGKTILFEFIHFHRCQTSLSLGDGSVLLVAYLSTCQLSDGLLFQII